MDGATIFVFLLLFLLYFSGDGQPFGGPALQGAVAIGLISGALCGLVGAALIGIAAYIAFKAVGLYQRFTA